MSRKGKNKDSNFSGFGSFVYTARAELVSSGSRMQIPTHTQADWIHIPSHTLVRMCVRMTIQTMRVAVSSEQKNVEKLQKAVHLQSTQTHRIIMFES